MSRISQNVWIIIIKPRRVFIFFEIVRSFFKVFFFRTKDNCSVCSGMKVISKYFSAYSCANKRKLRGFTLLYNGMPLCLAQ